MTETGGEPDTRTFGSGTASAVPGTAVVQHTRVVVDVEDFCGRAGSKGVCGWTAGSEVASGVMGVAAFDEEAVAVSACTREDVGFCGGT